MAGAFGADEQASVIPYVVAKGTRFGRPAAYPRYKYHEKHARQGVIVRNAEEEEALGKDWHDSPAKFGVETCPQNLTVVDAAMQTRNAALSKAGIVQEPETGDLAADPGRK